MKLLSLTAAAAALLLAAPVQAQEWRSSNQPAERIHGSSCIIMVQRGSTPQQELPCHHMVVTNGNGTPNFHFDNEDESAGVTFVMDPARPYADADSKGLGVVAIMFRYPGSDNQVFPLSRGGLCINYKGGWGCHAEQADIKVTTFLRP